MLGTWEGVGNGGGYVSLELYMLVLGVMLAVAENVVGGIQVMQEIR